MIRLGLAIAGILCVAQPAVAANCKKGKPCGNSCIAQNKVCRIGTTNAPATYRPRPVLSTASFADLGPGTEVRRNEPVVWIGIKANKHLYRPDCPFVRDFGTEQRAYFNTLADAFHQGYTKAADDGCPR